MSYNTCTWAGLTAPATAWRALGATRAQPYTNTPHGTVDFSRYMRSDDTPSENYIHELLIRARAELPTDASDTQIVERAVILRAQDRAQRGIHALAEAIQRAVASGTTISVDGSIQHLHAVVARLAGGAS